MHLIFLLLYQNQHHCTYQEVDEKSYVHATLLDTITMLSFLFFRSGNPLAKLSISVLD